jgi:tRNA threonylcarbamoyladenosine biosynthesis protein TsaB
MIDGVIGQAGLDITELDGFAVSNGPGSFTGLRIGIASVKGLAFSLKKPVVGVSSLKTLAYQCRQKPYLICPVIDARKHEVYYCRYRSDNGELKQEGPEQVALPLEAVGNIREPSIFIGSGAELYQQLIADELGQLAHFAAPNEHTIQASAVAWLSLPRFTQQDTEDVHLLAPHYIRKSDAQLSIGRIKP